MAETNRAFSLIELLAAMAVVVLLMMTVVQMMSNVNSLTATSGKRVAADADARTVFDRMADDFAGMVKRPDVDYLIAKGTGNDGVYFYSAAPALAPSTPADQNPVSLVGYRVNADMQLERVGKGLAWSDMAFLSYPTQPPDNSTPPLPSSTFQGTFGADITGNSTSTIIGENVFRMEFTFLLKPLKQPDGTFLPAVYSNVPWDTRAGRTSLNSIGLSDVEAVVVTIAILDSASRKPLANGKLPPSASSALTDIADPQSSPPKNVKLPAQVWQEAIDNGTFAMTGIPASLAKQTRIYQRIFPLSTP
jgi:prepilin-type N-terminal cleavage/methylation domain-containing protein